MDINNILNKVDHTLLSQTATLKEIFEICDDAIRYNAASVCIPPSYVKDVKEYVKDNMKICTVIGFPNGYSTTQTKCFEASDAVDNGADEIDMVINIGYVKDKKFDKVLEEINLVKASCKGRLLKVIIETCLLTENEKIKLCEIVSMSDADFIKTSTGFSICGATKEDITLFKDNVFNDTKIKAAGGISDLEDAQNFVELGAHRLGTSRIIKIVKNNGGKNEQDNSSY